MVANKLYNAITPMVEISSKKYKGDFEKETCFSILSDVELKTQIGRTFVFDLEIYPNYFLASFFSVDLQKVIHFELSEYSKLWVSKLRWLIDNVKLISFNGINFDLPLLLMAIHGYSNCEIYEACSMLIKGSRVYDIEKKFRYYKFKIDHVDLMQVSPLKASLKLYAARMHAPKLQDLPFEPSLNLSKKQMLIVKNYCINDLFNTFLLFLELETKLKCLSLRKKMSCEYKINLMSKSDAQIAEHVICKEVERLTGYYPKVKKHDCNLKIKYNVPEFISFKSDSLKKVLRKINSCVFSIDGSGKPVMPAELKSLNVKIGETLYNIGMGGLHSCEKSITHKCEEEVLYDIDVASYYPNIILKLGLYPEHIGPVFLKVYKKIVEKRLHAKNTGDKETNQTLKIVINGSFGKFGNMYSAIYGPNLMLQVTLTGQLTLLMLIEELELNDINVVSGNTDGIIIKCSKEKFENAKNIVRKWEEKTSFKMEYTNYKMICSRDVNNYIAIKENECKVKGIYSNIGSALASRLSKNPETSICSEAVQAFLLKKIPLSETIYKCNDITKFVSVRTVKGGAIKDGVYLGKAIRWYYKKNEFGTINYKDSGNIVPKTEGAWPLMSLPESLPEDLNFEWYIKTSIQMLYDIGFFKNEKQLKLF